MNTASSSTAGALNSQPAAVSEPSLDLKLLWSGGTAPFPPCVVAAIADYPSPGGFT
jgi:hypothetical protein